MKPKLLSALQALALIFCASAAHAQNYPVRPLRFLIPFPPGGGADSLARIVGAVAGESLGQQIVIDNRMVPAAISRPKRRRKRHPMATRCCSRISRM